jgi:hypothetical protein
MCDYEEEQIVQCPYNKFQMCLLGRMTKHMWKCHPTEYNRDRDIRFNKKCAEVLQQQQVDLAEGSWNNDTYPIYVPKKKPMEDRVLMKG